jgi:iron complex transport system substrate-binding protein
MAPSFYPRRIVCLTEETTETLYLLGEEERIVGISGFTVRPPRARKEKPKVSAFLDADIPAIEELAPDLVIAFSDLQADIARSLIRKGIEVLTLNHRSIEEILRMVVMVGSIVGKQAAAEKLADSLNGRVVAARERAKRLPLRPRVFFEEWPDPLISGIRWVSELIEVAGGDDLFAELRAGKLAKDRIVTPVEVVRRDPQLILGSWCGKKMKKDVVLGRPGFATTTAVRHDLIHEIKSSIILQPGPAALTDGLDALEKHISFAAKVLTAQSDSV